jgi:desampylase
VSGRVLFLSDDLAASVLVAAARAYPAECCGLIEGIETEAGWQALGVHEAANVAEDPNKRFLIDPQTQFDLMRRLRGTQRRILGCFHSHPGGAPEPSATDRADAFEAGFVYLIAGGDPESGFTLKAYVFDEMHKAFDKVALRH